jgi:nucleoside-diphosphate-sugar epimerase
MPGGKVAVTGGAGFLGSHIAKRVVDEGNEISIIDDMSAGSMRNLSDLGVKEGVTRGDLKDYGFAKRSLKGAETVFHFAAEVGSVEYLHGSQSRELAALLANVIIDANVFRACAENGVRSIIYASSVSVYPFDRQLGEHVKFREEDAEAKVNPEGGYGWSKYIAEKELSYMSEAPVGVARIFHAYGKNIYIKPDRSQVIASLMRKAIRYPKEDFVVWGNGKQRRCFVYVDDVVDGLFALLHHIEKKGSLTVNIGSTEEVTVMNLAKMIIALSGKKIVPKLDPSKPSGALNRMPDLSRVKQTLGWEPTTTFPVGLSKTFDWALTRL